MKGDPGYGVAFKIYTYCQCNYDLLKLGRSQLCIEYYALIKLLADYLLTSGLEHP